MTQDKIVSEDGPLRCAKCDQPIWLNDPYLTAHWKGGITCNYHPDHYDDIAASYLQDKE